MDFDEAEEDAAKVSSKKFGKKLDFSSSDSLKSVNANNVTEAPRSPRPLKYERSKKENSQDYEHDLVSQELQQLTSTPAGGKIKANLHLRSEYDVEFPEGSFFGLGRHKDGSDISKYLFDNWLRDLVS